jgi:anti-sigma regulatory factor (Ser/Thr protein kinase)
VNLATAIASSPITGGGVLVTVPLEPRAIRGARRLAARAAECWGRPDLADVAALLTSEIVTNAVRHANHRVRLGVLKVNNGLRVTVWDDGPGSPKFNPTVSPDAESGRGLLLLHELADAHGALLTDDGSKGVWFMLF